VCRGEEVLVSKRLRYVRPAEMVTLELEQTLWSRLHVGEEPLRVRIAPR
jgi:hypothetical protein